MSNPFTPLLNRARTLHLDPERDWLILLIASAIVLVSIVVWNAWTFDSIANGSGMMSSATSTPPIFSQSSLDAVHAVFANRATEETNYTSDVYHYVDPSQ